MAGGHTSAGQDDGGDGDACDDGHYESGGDAHGTIVTASDAAYEQQLVSALLALRRKHAQRQRAHALHASQNIGAEARAADASSAPTTTTTVAYFCLFAAVLATLIVVIVLLVKADAHASAARMQHFQTMMAREFDSFGRSIAGQRLGAGASGGFSDVSNRGADRHASFGGRASHQIGYRSALPPRRVSSVPE
jgi:uncharacterized membrane protein YgcG